MQVTIYRSSVKEGLYVYLQSETAVASLPAPVMKQLGDPEKAMEIELDKTRKLSNADAAEVLDAIESQGFYVQMPRDIEAMLAQVAGARTEPDE